MDQLSMTDLVPTQSAEELESAFHDQIRPALFELLDRIGVSTEFISFVPRKSYGSCIFKSPSVLSSSSENGAVIYRIKATGKSPYLEVKKLYKNFFSDRYDITEYEKNDYIRIPIQDIDVSELAIPLQSVLLETLARLPKEFDCCSRVDACSDAKKCISPYPTYGVGCTYCFNMAHGHIFYGRNENCDTRSID